MPGIRLLRPIKMPGWQGAIHINISRRFSSPRPYNGQFQPTPRKTFKPGEGLLKARAV